MLENLCEYTKQEELTLAEIETQANLLRDEVEKISNELKIDWTRPSVEIVRKINAFYPKPCTYTYLKDQRLKFGKAEVLEHKKFIRRAPGTLLVSKDKQETLLAIYCGSGMLKINLIQKESGNWIDAKSFINGFKSSGETVLGDKI